MAMERSFPIIQVVGFQNSGKTTLMERLIHVATEKGMQVASFKHHGHGGIPDQTLKRKDSEKHQQAGAFVSGVEGSGLLSIQSKRKQWKLEEIITLYSFFQPDVLFIEGYKQASFPKIVIIRDKNDWLSLCSLSNILCVISSVHLKSNVQSVPVFLTGEYEQCIDFVLSYIFSNAKDHFHDLP